MPQLPSHNPKQDEIALLSNDDVQVLDKIVRRAQDRIDGGARVFDALFSAYEEVFVEYGLDTSQDRTIFRFIFRLGQPHGDGLPLYQTFEQLLAEQNIVLEFEDEASQSQDSAHSVHARHIGHRQPYLNDTEGEPIPSRRASFTSLYDTTREISRQAAPRVSSRLSISKLDGSRARSFSLSGPGGPTRDSLAVQGSRVNNVSGTLHRRKNNIGLDRRHPGPDTKNQRFANQIAMEGSHLPGSITYSVSENDLARRAIIYNDLRRHGLLHVIIMKWAALARSNHSRTGGLEAWAFTKDRVTLMRQAFDLWRGAFQRLRHQRETERFFEHLYRRASIARDRYLLTKAFSHWRTLGVEEAARTGAARMHVLRLKYFNAWRDITVINELKAQRQLLKRPFNLLRSRFAQVCVNEVQAVSVSRRNLTRLAFYRWFWSFCDAAVPRYRQNRLQNRLFYTLLDKAKSRSQQELLASTFFVETTTRKLIVKWATAARIDLGGNHEADTFRRVKVSGGMLQKWKAEARLAPFAKRISNARDWRIAKECFSSLTKPVLMRRQAEYVDSLRLTRNSWTTWNDQLRIKALQSRIHERMTVQSIYRWVIQERYMLMRRIHDRGLQRRSLATLRYQWQSARLPLIQREAAFTHGRPANILSSILLSWKHQVNQQRDNDRIAAHFHGPRLALESIATWRSKTQVIHKKDAWAKDAHFYFSANRILKHWNVAAQEAQKRRRQAAYAAIRKMVKTNLAMRVLIVWQKQVRSLASLQERGRALADTRIRGQLFTIFINWQSMSKQSIQNEQLAWDKDLKRLFQSTLKTWQDTSQSYTNLNGRAAHFYHIHISDLCSSQLRRLSLRAFEIRCREQAADATRERHFDKHLRRMFKHWNDRTRLKMLEALAQDAVALDALSPEDFRIPSPSPDRRKVDARTNHELPRAEEWTSLNDVGVGPSNEDWIPPLSEQTLTSSTLAATPGYLNTPSKRAIRARALASISTTPVGLPPIRTPLAARLRGERDGTRTPVTDRERTARRVTFDESHH